MESLNNEEEFSWLSSSNGTNGSDDASKSTFKLSGDESCPLQNTPDINIDSKAGTDVVAASLSAFSESDMKSGNIDDPMPKEKVSHNVSLFHFTAWILIS